jgi:hypothetical protein
MATVNNPIADIYFLRVGTLLVNIELRRLVVDFAGSSSGCINITPLFLRWATCSRSASHSFCLFCFSLARASNSFCDGGAGGGFCQKTGLARNGYLFNYSDTLLLFRSTYGAKLLDVGTQLPQRNHVRRHPVPIHPFCE